jgi:hypothetical protein
LRINGDKGVAVPLDHSEHAREFGLSNHQALIDNARIDYLPSLL